MGTVAGDGDTGSLYGEQISAMCKTALIVIEGGPNYSPVEQTQQKILLAPARKGQGSEANNSDGAAGKGPCQASRQVCWSAGQLSEPSPGPG